MNNETTFIILAVGAFLVVCCSVAILSVMLLSGLFTTAKNNFLSLVKPTGEEKLLRDLLRDSKKNRDEAEAKLKLKELLSQLNSSVGSPSEAKSAAPPRQQPAASQVNS